MVVIGAGHNGLVCATYLAKRGQRVLVTEAREGIGGLAGSYEFHSEFHANLASHVTHFPVSISRDLSLEKHGLRAVTTAPSLTWLTSSGASVRLVEGVLSGVEASDARSYEKYERLMGRLASMLAPFWLKTVPRIGNNSFSDILSFAKLGLGMRLLGKDDMREFLRIVALPIRDFLDEYFDHPGLKAMLAWDALIGASQAPRSPNNSVIQSLYRSANKTMKTLDVDSLIAALDASARASGVEIRSRSRVARVLIEPGSHGLRTVGVELVNGETIRANRVVSSADPKTTFLNLVGGQWLEIEFAGRINRIRDRGLVSKLHLALRALPNFKGLKEPDGRLILAPDMDAMEWAFDDAKYGGIPETPVMEVTMPSLANAVRAPQGQHVLSANILYTPFRQIDDWSDTARAQLLNRCMRVLETYAPDIGEFVVASELLTPVDLARRFGVSGGHWHHGDMALDQLIMMRPTYGAAQYGTPIEGLFLCGAGSHPGGDLTGIPGHNAAKEILS